MVFFFLSIVSYPPPLMQHCVPVAIYIQSFDLPYQHLSCDQHLSPCHWVINMAEFQISQLHPITDLAYWVNSQSHVYVTLNQLVLCVYSLKTEDILLYNWVLCPNVVSIKTQHHVDAHSLGSQWRWWGSRNSRRGRAKGKSTHSKCQLKKRCVSVKLKDQPFVTVLFQGDRGFDGLPGLPGEKGHRVSVTMKNFGCGGGPNLFNDFLCFQK